MALSLTAVMNSTQGCMKQSKTVPRLRLGEKDQLKVVALAVGFVLSPTLTSKFQLRPMKSTRAHSWRDSHRESLGEKASPQEIDEKWHDNDRCGLITVHTKTADCSPIPASNQLSPRHGKGGFAGLIRLRSSAGPPSLS